MTEMGYVVGASMIRMGRYPGSSYAGLALPTVTTALRSAGVDHRQVQAVFCGHAFGGMLTGQRIMKELGVGGIPIINVDNACSGGATALHEAVVGIEEGRFDVAVAVGVDKLSQFGGGTIPLIEEDSEVAQGIVMPGLYAMRARRYMHERDLTIEDLAAVSVKARFNGSLNPYAQLRKAVTIKEVLESRQIADPLTLFQCCPTGDGAATVVVVSARMRKRLSVPSIRVRASVLHSGKYAGGFRNMIRPEISFSSAQEAYEMAGIDALDLDVVELHDAFSIAEIIYYEALGLCPEGGAAKMIRSGESLINGRVAVNPSGGLLAKGHPIGASGVAQVVEMYWQLLGQGGARQVPGARLGLTHVTGGGIANLDHGSCAIHVFESAS